MTPRIPVSYEEACATCRPLVSTKRIAELGLKTTMRIYNERLAELGWTTEMLLNEARRRMHERIVKLQGGSKA